MPDSIQVTSSSSWFSRLGKAFGGIIVGLVLLVIGVGLLIWNEGRAVKTYNTLKEGEGLVIDVSADAVNAANEGKLVHLTADATTEETLADEDFGISANAIRLRRDVEMYQWKENESSETRKKLGGGEETVTTYSYSKEWSGMLNNSSNFQQPADHENPGEFPFDSATWDAQTVPVGAFFLSPDLISQLSDFTELPVREIPEGAAWPENAKPDKGGIYLGANPAQPKIGDARIKFSVVKPGPVSLVAAQAGDSFAAYRTKAGGTIAMITAGEVSAQQMFEDAISQNTLVTWLVRLGGFILLWIGFALLFAPLSVLADVIPLLGSLVGAATGLIAFLLALAVALTVIAIAWVFFRPLLGITLLVLAVVAAVFGFRAFRKKPQAA
ncbi:MAG: TMEM43 family protein [Chthoniobacterales bacterium]|nr:TMEM43 family protein [Chthoniobacterales bacterium]